MSVFGLPYEAYARARTHAHTCTHARARARAHTHTEALPEDPECCCCTRDLWVGCWGWCGDGSDSTPTLAHMAPAFRAGEGALPGQVGGGSSW